MSSLDKVTPMPVAQDISPMAMISSAVNSGASPDTLKQMMDLQERYESNEAKKAFTVAMNQFKANPPKIYRDKEVAYTGTFYKHASLSNITENICSALAKHGLRHKWDISQDGVDITVTAVITHELGHSESVPMTSQADTSGKKNAIQAQASAITYMQRYTILSATGLAVEDGSDDDGGATEQIEQDTRQIALYQAFIDNFVSIAAIKGFMAEQNFEEAYEAWQEISDEDRGKLWVAPTKYDRAAFTTEERATFKSNEWTAARHAFHGTVIEEDEQ
jgi:hypothetical protein